MITYPSFHIAPAILEAGNRAMERIAPVLAGIDETTDFNQQKMMAAFAEARVSESHFAASTGYGYGDRGREALDQVYAFALGAEDALVRHNFVCGTHALTVALFGVLRPGDTMLSVTGVPYDTLQGVIGLTGNGNGSLREFGIRYEQVELTPDGKPDYEEIARRVKPGLRMAYIQRSRGYSLRPSLFVEEIGKIASIVKEQAPDCIVMVDNCYGEFVQREEPLAFGADLMAGSLIKNPGGGVAPTGGYIAGRRDLVESCAYRLTTPGTGREVGATLGMNRESRSRRRPSPPPCSASLATTSPPAPTNRAPTSSRRSCCAARKRSSPSAAACRRARPSTPSSPRRRGTCRATIPR